MSQLLQPSASLKTNPGLAQWLRFEVNGSVTVFTGKAELGQGILHALKLMAAHELDLPLDSVHIETANTQNSPDEGMTSGSLSVQDSGLAIRQACAHAAYLLKTHACASYAELQSHVDVKLPVDLSVPTKSTALTLTEGRDDIEALVQGQPIFLHDLGINVDLTPIKNLLHGRMVRGPGLRCTLRTEGWADAVAGLPKEVQAFRDGSLVGVVAPTEELAEKAASKLQRLLKWDVAALPDCREGGVDLVERAPAMDSQVFYESGEFHEASKDAKVYEAVYFRPALHHGSMGPSVALAVWEFDQVSSGLKVWSHTQGIFPLRKDLALALGIDAQQIEVQHVRGAGCYGHNGADDVAYNAAWLARYVPGQCVRVQWTREEEMQQSPLAPAMRVKLQATVQSVAAPTSSSPPKGRADLELLTWQHDVWSQGHSSRPGRAATPAFKDSWLTDQQFPVLESINVAAAAGAGAERNAIPPYSSAHIKVNAHRLLGLPFRTSALRSLGAHANVFACESFMDEIADDQGLDPVAFRLGKLKDPRARAVVQTLADQVNWLERRQTLSQKEGWGLGIAYARYKSKGAYCAVVAEVEVTHQVNVRRLWVVADIGEVIHADGAVSQLEGGAIQSTSWALKEQAHWDSNNITSTHWDAYPILRFSEVPEVQVHLMPGHSQNSGSLNPPLGSGEATQGPSTAAIANAVFHAVGVRVRQLPLTPDNLAKSALA
ncbi:molybdopterin cofactor-binding domain-containing protein [Limnohabitans sp. Rim11]|uniref:xanthine dehydrogenase family protein molybdopterin-binding subunit n=1 Tax=Limnohabitans sp. Rim11 TaxID=1100719 RepID=UPI000A72ABAD|nr:molybdopterin cofactor-binding domain-containing protein [Limnohabitans sp. Rim11]